MLLNRSLLIFILLIPLNFWAQIKLDSINYFTQKLENTTTQEQKLEILEELTRLYNNQTGYLDSLDKYSKMLLREAIRLGSSKYEIKGLIAQGRYNSSISNNDFAMRDFLKALRKNGDKENTDLCNIYNQLGVVWFSKGNYSKALQYFLSFESVSRSLGYKKGLIQAYLNIGWAYSKAGKKEKGEFFLKRD